MHIGRGFPEPGEAELTPGPNPARIRLGRSVEYVDTDASGHHHYGTVIRWMEAAEALMHRRLGTATEIFGSSPRVRIEIDFLERLYFLDDIEVEFGVRHVGNTSVHYVFEVRRGTIVAARGVCIAAYMPKGANSPEPWTTTLRRALTEGGDQTKPLD